MKNDQLSDINKTVLKLADQLNLYTADITKLNMLLISAKTAQFLSNELDKVTLK